MIVSPLWNDDLPVLFRLRAWGYQILAVCPDAVAFESGELETQPGNALAVRIAHLERTTLLRRLRQAGIWIADWQVDRPLDQAILASLGRTPNWFRNVGEEPEL